jgi:formate/nitrite transporter FocA (FNT family)
VLAANLLGAHIVTWVLGNTDVFTPQMQHVFAEISKETFAVTTGQAILRDIFGGWLIATLVWMRTALDSGQIPLIVIMTYFVALGGFTYIIAGSIEVLFLVMTGALPWSAYLIHYMLPVLLGNTIGGVSLVAVSTTHRSWLVSPFDARTRRTGNRRNNLPRAYAWGYAVRLAMALPPESAAWAAASRAIGTRYGEQET